MEKTIAPENFKEKMKRACSYLWSLVKHVSFLVLFSILYGCSMIECFVSDNYLHTHQEKMVFLHIAVGIPIIGFMIYRYRRQLKKSNPQNFGLHSFTRNSSVCMRRVSRRSILILLGAIVLSQLIDPFFSAIGLVQTTSNEAAVDHVHVLAPLVEIIGAVIGAPILEELIFRGFFFNYFFRSDTLRVKILGVFVSGVIFGWVHCLSITVEMLPYCAAGWLFGGVYIVTKDLRYPIIIHFINNFLASVLFL